MSEKIMTKDVSPSNIEKHTESELTAIDMTSPGAEVMLQLRVPAALKNEFKAYTALSQYKTMAQLFTAMFEEYKNKYPI